VNNTKLPVLFVSHGSPMFALEHGTTAPALTAWAAALPVQPTAVLIMSPHWMTRKPVVMAYPSPSTWHDFGGFPPQLYQLNYPAKGHPLLAQQVQTLLQASDIDCDSDPQRPFDHGAWVPLMHLFPKANVPVVQLSLPAHFSPQQLMDLGAALASLREQGVLIVGSGSMTHNLAEFFNADSRPALGAAPKAYVVEFSDWIEQRIMAKDGTGLRNYRSTAPHAVQAHPTDEHFVPLFFALGAAGDDTPRYLSKEVMYGILVMDAVAFG
jgi:4,5-DOPA dioxygenase extradiol